MSQQIIEIKPQPKQEQALSSSADVLIYGGAAGGGKSWTLLFETLRHISNPDFASVTFRRTSPMITNIGGLWDESSKLFPHLRAVPNKTDLSWQFPSGSRAKLAHLQHEHDVHNWQGAQIPLINFDELTHFTEYQFWYMFSRNRSTSGVKPYIRAGCNPDPDSFVAELIAWWIDQDEKLADGTDNPSYGFPIQGRAGVLRWFVRVAGVLEWANTREELAERHPELVVLLGAGFAKSLTFIPSDVNDNQKLLAANPEYLGNLYALPLVDRERLLKGNWKIRVSAGKFFNRAWFKIIMPDQLPRISLVVSFWDLAATEKQIIGNKEKGKPNDPDYSARVMIGYSKTEKRWIVLDAFQTQSSPAVVEKLMDQYLLSDKAFARQMGARFAYRWEQEPASAAKRETFRLVSKYAGTDARGVKVTKDKIQRAKEFARQAEHGSVDVLFGSWNNLFLNHIHNQPDEPHDDLMDAASGAFNESLTEFDFAGSHS